MSINQVLISKFGDASAEKPVVTDILGDTEELFSFDNDPLDHIYSLEDVVVDAIGSVIRVADSSRYSVVFVHADKTDGAAVVLQYVDPDDNTWKVLETATLTGASGLERVQIDEHYAQLRAVVSDRVDGTYGVYLVRTVSDDLSIDDFADFAIVYDHEEKTTGATIKFQYLDDGVWTDSQTATLTGAAGREVVDINALHDADLYRVIVTAYTDGEYTISKVRTKIPFVFDSVSSDYHLVFNHSDKTTGAVLKVQYLDDGTWTDLETATLTGTSGKEILPIALDYDDLRVSLTSWVDGVYSVASLRSTNDLVVAGNKDFTAFFKHTGKTTGATIVLQVQDAQGDWHTVQTATIAGEVATEIVQFNGPYSAIRAKLSSWVDGVYSVIVEAVK